MATSKIRTTASAEGARMPAAAPWDWAMDVGRQQMAVASEGAGTLLRGFEAMRRIHEQAAREATEHHAKVARKLGQPCTPAEMMALPGELVRRDLEAATRYWQAIAGAAMEMTTELCACGAHLVDTEDVLAATAPRFLHS